jgi:hypothetical protein
MCIFFLQALMPMCMICIDIDLGAYIVVAPSGAIADDDYDARVWRSLVTCGEHPRSDCFPFFFLEVLNAKVEDMPVIFSLFEILFVTCTTF